MARLATTLSELYGAFSNFLTAVSNSDVWLSIATALLLASVCLVLGIWLARCVGLITPDAPHGETLGVGLASGLIALTAGYATIFSGGRSSFSPIAVGLVLSTCLAVRGLRSGVPRRAFSWNDLEFGANARRTLSSLWSFMPTAILGAALIVIIALVNASTVAPSPNNGNQPIELSDTGYYAVLGSNLAATGTEDGNATSGFGQVPGLPPQTWYHWGEIWLAAAIIKAFGTAPLLARYVVVLPVIALAAGVMTGTVVRRMANTTSRQALAFGCVACLFLAPLQVATDSMFTSWAAGLIFGVTLYGVAALAVLLALYFVAVLADRQPTWALAGFSGTSVAFILPAHIVIAAMTCVGIGIVGVNRAWQALAIRRELPSTSLIFRRTLAAALLVTIATVAWGFLTGHGLGSSDAVPSTITPFGGIWALSIAAVALGAVCFWAIPFAWMRGASSPHSQREVYLGAMAVVVVGAVVWGAFVVNFNMYHVFFAGIAVVATPVAAVAIWSLLTELRARGRVRLAALLLVVIGAQLEVGAVLGVARLQEFGNYDQQTISVDLVRSIRELPPTAKLAYACQPLAEVSFAVPSLIALEAHTGRPFIPMCFEADALGTVLGAPRSQSLPNASFARAPQHLLYVDAGAHPTDAAVVAFLRERGIDYIYADERHPNTLVADAIPIAVSGTGRVFRLP